MQIAAPSTHRCLAYVAAVQRQGYELAVAEFRAYARKPVRRGQSGLGEVLTSQLKLRKMEPMLDYLYRLGWVDIVGPSETIEDDEGVVITNLGRAVLGALDEGDEEEELPTAIVLDQHDPVAKARVISEIAGVGESALVDRYFSADDFLAVLQRTEVTRVLTGPEPPKRLAGIGQALADVKRPRPFEVRVSDVFHDRFVIPVEGGVVQIGTSLGGVSKRLSVMVRMNDDAAAQAIRQAFEDAWRAASPMEPPEPAEAPDASTKGDAKATASEEGAQDGDVAAVSERED